MFDFGHFYCQYYLYEFAEEGDELHAKKPRQCCPHALLTFTTGSVPGPQGIQQGVAEVARQVSAEMSGV